MSIPTVTEFRSNQFPAYDFYKTTGPPKSAGYWHSLFYRGTRPVAASAPTPGLAGAALTSYTGQIPVPCTTPLVARLEASFPENFGAGRLMLADRLWHNSGITVTTTTAQTVNSVAFPARDVNGSTNGDGVLVAIEWSATSGNGLITNTTMSYTNSDGTAGRTATLPTVLAGMSVGSFIPFQLAAGDTGVRSIQTLTLGTTYASGTIHLVAYRPVCELVVERDIYNYAVDGVALGAPWAGSVPWLLVITGNAPSGGTLYGNVTFTEAS
jgi:hypothetical protein